MNISDQEVNNFIDSAFQQNLETIRAEGGHALTADVIQLAKFQVLLYYKKLKEIAQSVSETEVKLNLPFQKTRKGRVFGIEGVVDIVSDHEKTIMYDIKTHDADYVRANLHLYEDQLNVYAYIWKNLRGRSLDECAIIATAFPKSVKEGLSSNEPKIYNSAFINWQPLIEISINPQEVEHTVQEFAQVIDAIEDRKFEPTPVERIRDNIHGTTVNFAVFVCHNCDARFSCSSFRKYAEISKSPRAGQIRKYFVDPIPELDQEVWFTNNLDSQQSSLIPDELI